MATVSAWGEGIILSFTFVLILGVILASYNSMYEKDYSIGLDTSLTSDLTDYMSNSQTQIQGSDTQINSVYGGVTLKATWGIVTGFLNIIWSFIGGHWIETIAGWLNVGEGGLILAYYLRMLWFISVVFAVLYSLLKVVI